MNIFNTTLSFIRQLGDSVIVHNNLFHYGYTELCYHRAKYPSEMKTVSMEKEDILIEGLSTPDHYIFFVKTKGDKVAFKEITYITNASQEDILDKIQKFIQNPVDETFIENELLALKDAYNIKTPLLTLAVERFRKIQDKQEYEKESYYQIISTIERYENLQSIIMNAPLLHMATSHNPNFKIKAPNAVTDIYIVKHENGLDINCCHIKPDSYNRETELPVFKPDTLYSILLYSDTELLGKLMHYSFDEEGMSYFWNLEQERIDNSGIATIDDEELEYINIDLSPEEKKYLLEEKQEEPKNWLIPRVLVEESHKDSRAVIEVPDYDLLVCSDRDYFLAAKENDELKDNAFERTTPLSSRIIEFNLPEHNMRDSIFYIKDDKNKIVSKFARYNEKKFIDYEINKNLLEMHTYAAGLFRTLKPYTNKTDLDSYLSSEITALMQTANMNTQKLCFDLIGKVLTADYIVRHRMSIVYAILNDWFLQFDISNTLIDDNAITYYTGDDRLIFGPGNAPHILVKISYNVSEGIPAIAYYEGSLNSASSFNATESDLNIFYAINTETGERTGFVLHSNIAQEECLLSNSMKVEVMSR